MTKSKKSGFPTLFYELRTPFVVGKNLESMLFGVEIGQQW
jgi:hypothetical protein